MPLVVVGLSHHQVAADELAVLEPVADELAARLSQSPVVAGLVVLSTCNRFEAYVDAEVFHPTVELVTRTITELAGPSAAPLMDALQVHVGQGAVEHCLTVACGLDSMVVGEAEVAGQVRAALAHAGDRASATLHRLFQHALTTSKAVTSSTGLGAAGRSVASVGLDLVESRHGSLPERRILLVGTGAYARVVSAELARRGCTDVWVHSSTGRATAFAATHPVRPIDPDRLVDELARAQLVITCSGSNRFRVTRAALAEARFGAQSALPIVDLALKGDVESAAAELPGVDLIDLEVIGEHAPSGATTAVLRAQEVVARATEAFLHLEGGRAADPAVVAMRAHIMGIIECEQALVARKYPPEVAEAVARSLRRVSNSLMHTPSLRAHELARTGELDDYRRAMYTLFGIEVPSAP